MKDLSCETVRFPNRLLSWSINLLWEVIDRARLLGSSTDDVVGPPPILEIVLVAVPFELLASPCLRFYCLTERVCSFMSGRFPIDVSMNFPGEC